MYRIIHPCTGASVAFAITPTSELREDVFILLSFDTSEILCEPSEIQFNITNWDAPATVTVIGIVLLWDGC